jgi:hypothetical protein
MTSHLQAKHAIGLHIGVKGKFIKGKTPFSYPILEKPWII